MGVTGDGVTEIPKPTPGSGEVRVKVIASAVNPGEEKVIGGDFVGRFLHAKTSPSPSQEQGAFTEYLTSPRAALAAKPDDVPYHIAAAAATVAMTALKSLRDLSRLGDGGKALIIGAGGGIGSVAVGIGKRLGGHVTGVCSTKDVERVGALSADAIIDRKKSDPLDAESAYDVVLDTPGVHPSATARRCCGPAAPISRRCQARPWSPVWRVRWSPPSVVDSFQVAPRRADLELVGACLSDGLDVPIDSRHKIADLGAAPPRDAGGVVEAVNAGARLLLFDEDSSATNFLIKDEVMRQLLRDDPIIPRPKNTAAVLRLRSQFHHCRWRNSVYLSVADRVILMENYQAKDVTSAAKVLAPQTHTASEALVIEDRRILDSTNFDPSSDGQRLGKRVEERIKPLRGQPRILEYGNSALDLASVSTLMDKEQVLCIGRSLLKARELW